MSVRRSHTEIPASLSAPADGRRWLAGLEAGLDPELRAAIVLMLSELIANSLVHAEMEAGETIDVDVEHREDAIRIRVSDPGAGFDAKGHPAIRTGSEMLPQHGFGLQLVDTLAARWGVEGSRPTTVWFEVDTG